MAELGGFCSFPVELGGGPSPSAKIYRMLKDAVGTGGAAFDDLEVTTIDGAWFAAKAEALAAIESADEAAHWQAFPDHASDELQTYEEILRIPAVPGTSTEDRRSEVVERWTQPSEGDLEAIGVMLREIDERFLIILPSRDDAFETIHSRDYTGPLGDENPKVVLPRFEGPSNCHRAPNYSTSFIITAFLPIGSGILPTNNDAIAIERASTLLDTNLPAWCNWQVATDNEFVLDQSRLDLTMFGS